MRRNWPFFKDSDWLIIVFVHSAKPTAELQNLAMSPSSSSPRLSYDTKFVHIGWELRSSLVGDTILGVQSEPACIDPVFCIWFFYENPYKSADDYFFPPSLFCQIFLLLLLFEYLFVSDIRDPNPTFLEKQNPVRL